MAATIEEQKFRHIHAHWATHPTTAALIISELTGLPFSFAFHAYDLFETRILIPEKMEKAAFVIVNSRYTLNTLRKLYPECDTSKVELLYNGLDLASFAQLQNRKKEEAALILAIGRLVPTKGFAYFVKACGLLRDEGKAFTAVIVGAGPEEKSLQAFLGTHGLEHSVYLAGELPEKKIREFLAEASFLVMPCVTPRKGSHDALPNVIIEAQAAGTPVVATPVFAIPEIVENGVTGLLVPERDALELKNAMARLLDDPALGEQLALSAQEQLEGKFDAHVRGERLMSLFESCGAVLLDPNGKP